MKMTLAKPLWSSSLSELLKVQWTLSVSNPLLTLERSLNDRTNGVPILMYTGTVLNVFRTNANKSKLECNARNTYNLKYVIANAKVQFNSIST